jgi:hypothetical protein
MSTAVNFPDLSAGGTIFLVAKQSTINGATNFDAGAVFIGAGSGINMQIVRGSTTVGPLTSIEGAINSSVYAESGSVVADDTFVTIRLKYDGTNIKISINNGTEVTQASSGGGYVATPMQIFKTLGGAQGNKQIAEILIYKVQLDSSVITHNETYLRTKYAHY